jgi:hypothetical protein
MERILWLWRVLRGTAPLDASRNAEGLNRGKGLSFPLEGDSNSIRNRTPLIEVPDPKPIIESRRTAHRCRITIRRIHADTESKPWAISPAAVISATTVIGAPIDIPAIEVCPEVPTWRREGTSTEIPSAWCGIGVSTAKSSRMAAAVSAAAIRCHHWHWTESRHGSGKSYRSDRFLN